VADASVHGIAEVIAALEAAALRATVAATTIVTRGQAIVEAEAKKSMTGAHPRGAPSTSAPGAPPDVVTGTLRRSIMSSTPESLAGGGAVGRIYPTAVYARIQELGGTTGRNGATTLPARPYMQPAHEASKPRLEQIAIEEWGRLIP
jgi:HK97 gp10 family phage protein